MIDNEIYLTANQSPIDDLAVSKPDFSVALHIQGSLPVNAEATLTFGSDVVCTSFQADLYSLFARALGSPFYRWQTIADDLGLHADFPKDFTTIQQNLAKALMLVALWIEPQLNSEQPQPVVDKFDDELIIDYSGVSERQRYIYFPPQSLLKDSAQRLYRLHLLSLLTVRLDGEPTVARYFVPLVAPGVIPRLFDQNRQDGGAAYQTWQDIRRRAGSKIQRIVRR